MWLSFRGVTGETPWTNRHASPGQQDLILKTVTASVRSFGTKVNNNFHIQCIYLSSDVLDEVFPKFKVPCILKMPFRNEVYKCLLKPLMPLWILVFFLFIEMPLYLFTLLNVFFILSEWNQNNFFYNVVMELF